MEDDIHAVLLLATIPLAAYIVWRWGRRVLDARRIIVGLCIGVLAGTTIWAALMSYCPRPGPSVQVWLPVVLGTLAYIFIDEKWGAIACILASLVVAIALGLHFHTLPEAPSTTALRHADAGRAGDCAVQKGVREVWHTPITGVYSR